jgi:acetyl-CoA carboxylase biotin carboxylase subunit
VKRIKKILIANRGEIALRIMRSAKEMGIGTVAVYSQADRNTLHVRYADEAIFIGDSPASESYLSMEKIISAAKRMKADAIHPGYGFLSENPEFAEKIKDARIIFIGPSAHAMELLGNKLAAKAIAKKYNIPVLPGTTKPVSKIDEAKKHAKTIGYPVLIKAAAGGGGKGMRMVATERLLEENLMSAMSEAKSAFGDESVFIEKYIESPRHIEIQVMGDTHGNVVHLFERECSIQRRHQKVIEEAPSGVLTPLLREKMGACAVALAKACGYYNAGTVEFLLDEKNNFYFLEMNTRLQVEHPVTEMITGIDLVKEQIHIAQGEKLSFRQDEIKIRGHSIEARIYAEDAANNFLPDTGTLTRYKTPRGNGIRVDDGYEEGMEIPVYYDSMLAKLIAHSSTRSNAIAAMRRALNDYIISGVETTIPFCRFVVEHPAFISGKFDTHFAEKHFTHEKTGRINKTEEEIAAVAAAIVVSEAQPDETNHVSAAGTVSKWKNRKYMDEDAHG